MQSYLITSKVLKLQKQLQTHMPTYALYRDKSNPDYDSQAEFHVQVCSQFDNIKSFIHQDSDLAFRLGATGVHLTSKQFDEISHAKELGLEVIISTHTHDEVIRAQSLGADAVTYSPIFDSPGKSEPKGLEDLKGLITKTDIDIFALGGIVESEQIKKIQESGAFGFASIRYFY